MDRTETARALVKKGAVDKKRLAREGKKLIKKVVSLRESLQRTSYELGVALGRLKDDAMLSALGYESFRALCDTALRLSTDLADDLIAIAKNFSAAQAKTLGTAKAVALVDLARALPGKHTAAGLLTQGTVRVGQKSIRVRAASAHEITAQARAVRALRPGSKRGVHLSLAERHVASTLAHALLHRHVQATVRAIAGSKETGGRLRIELPIRAAADLRAALAEIPS